MSGIRRPVAKEKWCEITITDHALARLGETTLTLDQALECFERSCQEELSQDYRRRKAYKYGEEGQVGVSFWRFGSILFITKEVDRGLVLLSIHDQQIGSGFFRHFRRNTDGKSYRPNHKRYEPEERTKPPWR